MMVPHYILVEHVCCSSSSSARQAFGVALVEDEAMVVDEQVVEENERDESCTGASTPDKVHSTEAVAEHKSEMNEQLVGHNMDL